MRQQLGEAGARWREPAGLACRQGVEQKKTETMYIMGVISLGVCIASYGARAPLGS